MAGGGLGFGRRLWRWSGNGVVRRRIRRSCVGGRLACLLSSQSGRGGGQNDIDENDPLHPDLLSRSKDLLTSVRPCGDGKVLRPPRLSRPRRTTNQCRSEEHTSELQSLRHL